MADFSKWPFFKITNSQNFVAKISQIGPWVSKRFFKLKTALKFYLTRFFSIKKLKKLGKKIFGRKKKISTFFFLQMYNLIIKCPKLKSSALGSFLLYEKDKCNDCNCSFTLNSKN